MLPKALALADEIASNAGALSVALCKHLVRVSCDVAATAAIPTVHAKTTRGRLFADGQRVGR